jgi:D-psicose/D-tagatose/L-ribulose 3-epimerase
MGSSYRFAICNELFQKTPFREACKTVREIGYEGLEIAPFTLAESPRDISAAQRSEISQTLADEGLSFVGLHWLMVSPAGLHVTSPDQELRKRSWNHIHDLVDLCADLAGSKVEDNGLMIFGSPKQRSAVGGMAPKEAADVFAHELGNVAPHAESRGVTILVEALPANQSDVINTLAEAMAIVKQIGSPAIQTMFDTHNAVDETEPHTEVIRKYFSHIRHIHVNEIDGREPGMGDYDFGSILATLSKLNYAGWVSLEAFDFSRDPIEVAKRAFDHLNTRTASLSLAE